MLKSVITGGIPWQLDNVSVQNFPNQHYLEFWSVHLVAYTFLPAFCGVRIGWYIASQSSNNNCFLLWSGIQENHKTMPALTPQVCRLHQNKDTLFPGLLPAVSSFVLRHRAVNKFQVLALLCFPHSGAWIGSKSSQMRGGLVGQWLLSADILKRGNGENDWRQCFKAMMKILLKDSVIFSSLFIYFPWKSFCKLGITEVEYNRRLMFYYLYYGGSKPLMWVIFILSVDFIFTFLFQVGLALLFQNLLWTGLEIVIWINDIPFQLIYGVTGQRWKIIENPRHTIYYMNCQFCYTM